VPQPWESDQGRRKEGDPSSPSARSSLAWDNPLDATRMKFNTRTSLNLVILIGIIAFFAVCLHSVEEIHYLKSFFPEEFTVEESFYAAAIELIKVIIIGIPVLLIIGICLRKLRE
jgi:hypothetical protein